MMKRWLLSLLVLSLAPALSFAQKECGYAYAKAGLLARNPSLDIEKLKPAIIAQKLARVTVTTSTVTIPVVFHIVLDTATLRLIGDSAGVADRATSQIAALNEDYNRENADSTDIPTYFKPLYGNVNIKFGLAHTAPDGTATNGWDITITTQKGFNANSNDPCYQAKHDQDGGKDAWDVTSYINIWIINFLDGTQPSNIIGLTIPPSFTQDTISGYPKDEMGILINANAFGRRSSPEEYFYPGIDLGRTLTHEMGHYFGLFHTWGDDGGLCPGDVGGHDDGIADTPPEGNAHYGCSALPYYDNCSPSGNGVMIMNYMDYSDDKCMFMFTNDQVAVMNSEIAAGGESFSLTTHSQLLDYPGNTPTGDNSFTIGPNPAHGGTYLNFTAIPQGLQSISLINTLGQYIQQTDVTGQQATRFGVNLNGLAKGMYFVRVKFAKSTIVKKIIIQ
jgi:hypothetical protein